MSRKRTHRQSDDDDDEWEDEDSEISLHTSDPDDDAELLGDEPVQDDDGCSENSQGPEPPLPRPGGPTARVRPPPLRVVKVIASLRSYTPREDGSGTARMDLDMTIRKASGLSDKKHTTASITLGELTRLNGGPAPVVPWIEYILVPVDGFVGSTIKNMAAELRVVALHYKGSARVRLTAEYVYRMVKQLCPWLMKIGRVATCFKTALSANCTTSELRDVGDLSCFEPAEIATWAWHLWGAALRPWEFYELVHQVPAALLADATDAEVRALHAQVHDPGTLAVRYVFTLEPKRRIALHELDAGWSSIARAAGPQVCELSRQWDPFYHEWNTHRTTPDGEDVAALVEAGYIVARANRPTPLCLDADLDMIEAAALVGWTLVVGWAEEALHYTLQKHNAAGTSMPRMPQILVVCPTRAAAWDRQKRDGLNAVWERDFCAALRDPAELIVIEGAHGLPRERLSALADCVSRAPQGWTGHTLLCGLLDAQPSGPRERDDMFTQLYTSTAPALASLDRINPLVCRLIDESVIRRLKERPSIPIMVGACEVTMVPYTGGSAGAVPAPTDAVIFETREMRDAVQRHEPRERPLLRVGDTVVDDAGAQTTLAGLYRETYNRNNTAVASLDPAVCETFRCKYRYAYQPAPVRFGGASAPKSGAVVCWDDHALSRTDTVWFLTRANTWADGISPRALRLVEGLAHKKIKIGVHGSFLTGATLLDMEDAARGPNFFNVNE
jgi:hypothetical protein